MQHSAEIRSIKNTIKTLRRRKPKEPKSVKELDTAIEELKIQEINLLIFEQSLYEDEGKIHFLDVLGLSPREYIELENELIEKKLKRGANIEIAIEKSGLDRDKYYLEMVKTELRKRKMYHPNKNRAWARERIRELKSMEGILS